MFKNMKIGTQIVIASFVLVVIATGCTSITAIKYFTSYVQETATNDVGISLNGFKNTLETEMQKARNFRDSLLDNIAIGPMTALKNREGLIRDLEPLMRRAGVGVLTIIADDGTVVARMHNHNNFGDNVGTSGGNGRALAGENYEEIISAPSARLGFYCGGPIKHAGKIVGTFRVAVPFEDAPLVDNVKTLFGDEAAIYAGKTRINTTLQNNGKRMIDTDAPTEAISEVLEKGNDYIGEANILGEVYLTAYTPIRDNDGKTVGMLFTGESLVEMKKTVKKMIATITLVSMAMLIVAFIIAFLTARRISRPLKRIVSLAERCKGGDLTISRDDFQFDGGGELGVLVDALSGMVAAQLQALLRVVRTSDDVTGHANTLGSVTEENAAAIAKIEGLINEVSSLCNTNSEAVDRGAASISEMASGANSVAKMSVDSADALARTTGMSTEAVNSVNGLVSEIALVDSKTIENQEKIRGLSSSVSEISNFMGVIASIADQTNLLALNAAIEAARAGEAGRGFAVVAEEVRKLAEESRNASKSVEELVVALSENAGDAIEATEQSVQIVNGIRTKAGITVDGLNGALREITNVNDAIQSIAAVAQEQAAGSSEISTTIDEIRSSTAIISEKMADLYTLSSQTADIGNSVSESATEMSNSADEMKEVLFHFKMDSDQNTLQAGDRRKR